MEDLSFLRDKKIGVLMGGISSEREISLRSGAKVLDSLKRQGFEAVGIDPEEGHNLVDKLRKIDISFIALHGKYGEDGTMQGLLEVLQIPYTGSGVLSSALGMNKVASKRIFQACGIPTPEYWVFEANNGLKDECAAIIKQAALPIITKPTCEGSSLGITIVKTAEQLRETVELLLLEYQMGFAEKFIKGTSVTVGILGTGKDLRALPILELVPKNEFYDYEAKYTQGMTDFIIPARLKKDVYTKAQDIAVQAYQALGCHGFARVDIMVSGQGIPYVHEVNTIPGLTDLSDLPAAAAADGIGYDELILEILSSAVNREKTGRLQTDVAYSKV